MATYSVSFSKKATLVANTLDTVTVTGIRLGVEIFNTSATDSIWFTRSNGGVPIDPTTSGSVDGSALLPPNSGMVFPFPIAVSTTVKLISTGTPTYTVFTWVA